MAEVGGMAAGLPGIDGYPNRSNRGAWVMLAMMTSMDGFLVVVIAYMMGTSGLPFMLFIIASSAGFCYFNIRAQYVLNPVRVKVERDGLRFFYRTGKEEEIVWDRIADMNDSFGERPGAAVVQLVDRFFPVAIPVEVVEKAAPLVEEAEERAEERSTAQNIDPGTRASKQALRSKDMARKLVILMIVSMPCIILLAAYVAFWL